MSTENILQQLSTLIQEGEMLRRGNTHGQCISHEHLQQCKGIIGSIHSFFCQNVPENNGYYKSAIAIINTDRGFMITENVGSLTEILKRLKSDIENGFLKGFESQISAEIFDTFLDHGENYLRNNMKNEAGVIIGVTFEDTIRKLARLNEIDENGVKLDVIISSLQSNNVFSGVESKRARSSAAVRTSAAHARWEEFTEKDVDATLTFTRELITKIDSTI